MMQTMNWYRFIRELCGKYRQSLVTRQEFEEDIKMIIRNPDSPFGGLVYAIKSQRPLVEIELGIKGKGEPTHVIPCSIEGEYQTECVIRTWSIPRSISSSDIERKLGSLFDDFWKPSIRATPSGLISIKHFTERVKQCGQNTLSRMIEQSYHSSLLFCDLDNFKLVNDQIGMKHGDRVIAEFASILERITGNIAVPLNDGGDEYVVFYPKGSYEEALLLAYEIKNALIRHDLQIGNIDIDVSIGIATNDNMESPKSFSDLLEESELSLKREVKEKKKGLARFLNNSVLVEQTNDLLENLKLALCITKSNLLDTRIYNNIWLNALSMFISKTLEYSDFSLSKLQDYVDDFIGWADFDYDNKTIKTSIVYGKKIDLKPEVSLLDITMALSHGLMKLILSNSSLLKKLGKEDNLFIYFNKDYDHVALGLSSDKIIWLSEKTNDSMDKFSLGKIWTYQGKISLTPACLRLGILMKIGHEELNLPENVFSEIIVVDDRPVRGGGLPDFWEATIARLIACLTKSPNILSVFVIGNKEYGMKSIEKLQNAHNWDTDFIHEKTGIPIQAVEKSSQRLKDIVNMVENEKEIVDSLYDLLQSRFEPLPIEELSIIHGEQRFLERKLVMDSVSLAQKDGCRVETISEAFPTVLEIARSIEEKEIICDQAGYKLHELVDFKVCLTKPLKNQIPQFYLKEKESLEDYFKKQFLSDDGLFGRVFKETHQLEEVINHVVQAIRRSPEPFATRRGILVIPHQPTPGQEITPLGLVSIRCIPRITAQKIILNYSYTWRTVEALVGFPYSVYGSVRYSEFLSDEIHTRLPGQYQDKVELGFVSYIAHSLHMFVDDYGQNIAKRIVDDASK